jgi:hypothetical protein
MVGILSFLRGPVVTKMSTICHVYCEAAPVPRISRYSDLRP